MAVENFVRIVRTAFEKVETFMESSGEKKRHDRIGFFHPLSNILDLRHRSSAMCIIMLGRIEDTGWAEIGRKNGIENQS